MAAFSFFSRLLSEPASTDRVLPRCCCSCVFSRSDFVRVVFFYFILFFTSVRKLLYSATHPYPALIPHKNHHGVLASAETTTTRTSPAPTLPPDPKGRGPAHHLQQRREPRATTPSAAAGPTTSQGGPAPIAPRDGAAGGGAPRTEAGGAGGAGVRGGASELSATTPAPNQKSSGVCPMVRPAAQKCVSPSMWLAR